MRAFVALDLPEVVLGPIAGLQAGLGVGRTVEPEVLHLTLAFLGEVSENEAADCADVLAGTSLPPVTLTLKGLDLFGGKRPAVLFVAAEGEGLDRLHGKVARAVREAGLHFPRERFRPHVTIARFGKEMSARDQVRLGEFLMLNGRFALEPVSCETVTLYRSHLREAGAIHEPLAQFSLGA